MASLFVVAVALLANCWIVGAFSAPSHLRHQPSTSSALPARRDGDDCEVATAPEPSTILSPTSTRRDALVQSAKSIVAVCGASILLPQQVSAAAGSDQGIVSQSKLASLLKQIPTFAIVDPKGVPYFVVGEDAKLTSYFFLSYGEAKRILDVASKSSDNAIKETKKEIKAKKGKVTKEDEEEIGTNPWKSARITSVPLDLAVSLASKGKLAGAYFRLAPSESDIEDALAVDGTDDLPEGRVPLFYVEDMTIAEGAETISPLYFNKDQLIADWDRRQKKAEPGDKGSRDALPTVKVTELFATITEMARPGGTDKELKTLRFIPPTGSKTKAEQCTKAEKEPFKLGERLIVL